jgi:hypothetical protein
MGLSPTRVREMLKKELRQMLRDPKMRGALIVAPIIMLVMFGYAVTSCSRFSSPPGISRSSVAPTVPPTW